MYTKGHRRKEEEHQTGRQSDLLELAIAATAFFAQTYAHHQIQLNVDSTDFQRSATSLSLRHGMRDLELELALVQAWTKDAGQLELKVH